MGSDANHHEHDRPSTGGPTSGEDGSYVDDDLDGGTRTRGPHDGEADGTYTEEADTSEADGTYTEEAGTSEGDGSYVDAQVPDEPAADGGPHDGEPDGSFTQSDLDGGR
ncbi:MULTISPECIES: hypothetical protein [unclassified Frigoribacterium]|uniref:hypothetical protein n=1 Tax=unclassified Frigoribacterium TaxID=2627005 RepID=UPI0006F2B13D|nr:MULTISPECIES: hypothetical protein [unclassified Frigoribacterium]KQM25082.1 hypothetical protein ASL10_05405 [Frigoribacterium sp. Leaf8]WAC50042.1 hypothetical protein OVA02_08985 [Frigoribacterium sp. SL97]